MKKIIFLASFCSMLFADNGFLIKSEEPFDTGKILETIERKSAEDATVEKMVEDAAVEGGIEVALAKAIAKVESNFNPKAVSSSNAIGVMQLKMDTAVKDIYATFYQSTMLPDKEALFDPRQNAKLGVAYLKLLQQKYLKDINDTKSIEYCTIASYNAGAGTVLRTFHDDKAEAAKVINSLSSDEVLRRLMNDMRSEQGRRYVVKVLEAKKGYKKSIEVQGE